ncbi:hypothetical protein K523DRAFT_5479, partial [Schizophyllum commune Tattone D]
EGCDEGGSPSRPLTCHEDTDRLEHNLWGEGEQPKARIGLRDEICDEGFRTSFRRGRTAGGESKVPSAPTREKGTFRWDRAVEGARGHLSAQCEEGGAFWYPQTAGRIRALPSALVTAGRRRRRSIRAFGVKKAMGEGTPSPLPPPPRSYGRDGNNYVDALSAFVLREGGGGGERKDGCAMRSRLLVIEGKGLQEGICDEKKPR